MRLATRDRTLLAGSDADAEQRAEAEAALAPEPSAAPEPFVVVPDLSAKQRKARIPQPDCGLRTYCYRMVRTEQS
jgi:hypothetical protein